MLNISSKLKQYENVRGIYNPTQIGDFLKEIEMGKVIKTNKQIEYYNIPCAFDIETTSFKEPTQIGNKKGSIMYEWTLGINWVVMIGRTWEEFKHVYNSLVTFFNTWEKRRLVIYIHNASFEFQAIRKHFKWNKVFSVKERKPVQMITVEGIEFRCSYILSGYGLSKLTDQLTKYKVKKQVGDLDYSLKRHSKTPLTKQEIKYCLYDVLVVMAYIQELIERDGNITKIPLTKTGYVRNYCRNECYYEDKSHRKNIDKYLKYRNLMKKLTLTTEEYTLLKAAFMGGFTHANPHYSIGVFYNVDSYDFTSSYPYVMISEKFPMSKGEYVEIKTYEELENNIQNYCCILDIKIFNLQPKVTFENYLSSSHCRKLKNVVENNGRVVSADYLETTITEQDYFIMKYFYSWDNIIINKCIRYKKGYLPTDFIKSILKLYVDKTQLKGVKDKEVEYLVSKENVNSCYGMCVTDICKEDIIYNGIDCWEKEPPNIEKLINKYNKSKRRFLSYPWGIWVTAYARFNLFTGICEFKDDYIYSDTDSIKVQNSNNHKTYLDMYNKLVRIKLQKAMKYHNLPLEMCSPKTIKGVEKTLGVWDYECTYSRFKTLGAKRYMTECDGEISITVSGLNKHIAVPYLKEKYGNKIFEAFNDNLYIPPEFTGKMTHTYIDEEIEGYIEDYLGNKEYYHELSGTHLENCDYSLSISQKYINYILGIQEYEK